MAKDHSGRACELRGLLCAACALFLLGCASSAERSAHQSEAVQPAEVQPPGPQQVPLSESEEESQGAQPQAGAPALLVSEEAPGSTTVPSPSDLPVAETEPQGPPASPCAQVAPEDEPMLDETRRKLEETTCSAALWLDGLFGQHGDVAAARAVHGFVELSADYSQFQGTHWRLRMDVRAELPTLRHRLHAFVGRDFENKYLRDRSEGFALRSQFPQLEDREGWLGGLGYALPGNERLRSEFRVGVHGLNPPQVFAQWHARYNVFTDPRNVVYLRVTPFWNSRDGLGFTASFDWSHLLSPTRLLRASNVGTMSEYSSQGVDWRSALILYQNLARGRGAALELFIRGATDAPERLGEYGGRAIYRQPLLQQKLFAEFLVGYSWPRLDPTLPREGSAEAGVSLSMPFGQQTGYRAGSQAGKL